MNYLRINSLLTGRANTHFSPFRSTAFRSRTNSSSRDALPASCRRGASCPALAIVHTLRWWLFGCIIVSGLDLSSTFTHAELTLAISDGGDEIEVGWMSQSVTAKSPFLHY